MKNAFVIVTLSGLLSACAVAPAPQAAFPAPTLTHGAAALAQPGAEPALPKVALTGDLLFQLLKAEFEAREGRWQGAWSGLLELARQTRDPRLARRAAEVALQARQGGEALAAVRVWRVLAPDSDEATQFFLGLAVLSDDLEEAGAIFAQRLAQAGPMARPAAMHQVQQYLARAPDKVAASALLGRLLAPYANSFEARLVLSQDAFARGDAAQARALAQAALAQRPGSELAVLTLAQATPEADQVALLDGFLAGHPDAREVRSAHARLLVSQKRYADARAQFELLLKDQPSNQATLYALGLLSLQMQDASGAEAAFTRYMAAYDASPSDERGPGRVLLALAQLAAERGDQKAAGDWLDRIEDDDAEHYLQARIRRAVLLAKDGKLDAARAVLAAVRSDDPAEQAQLLLARAQLERDAGRLQAAYALLDEGARRYASNPDVLYDYALMAEKLGKLAIMESTLRKVMQQAPDNHHAYNALGYSLAERNLRLPEALTLIDKALQMAPDDPFILDSKGWVLYRMGRLDEAADHLRRAYAQRSDPEIAVHLGEVLWRQGQKAEARALWRAARAKDPKNLTLKSTLARLQQQL